MLNMNIRTAEGMASFLEDTRVIRKLNCRAAAYALNTLNRYPECDTRGYDYLKRLAPFKHIAVGKIFFIVETSFVFQDMTYHLSAHNSKVLYKQACSLIRHLEQHDGEMTEGIYHQCWALNMITDKLIPEFKIYNNTHPFKSGVVFTFKDRIIKA